MQSAITNKIPIRLLIRSSGRLFLLFLLGSLLITSIQDLSLRNLGQRAFSLGSLFIGIFIINTYVFYYFDKKRKNNTERIWKKTFALGFVMSLAYFVLHFLVITQLEKIGLIDIKRDVSVLKGWRLVFFVLYSSLVVYSFIFLIQNSVLAQYEKNQMQLELLQLQASNAETVNQLLRQQIQPHFLFNALNVLKSLIKRDKNRAEHYLLHLSDFLRLSIAKNSSGVSTLKEELKICNDYMEMQSIRFTEAIQYQVDIPNEDHIMAMKLPFFSLQPLLENAIKHNELTLEQPLYIKISKEGNYIKVSNNLQEKSYSEPSSGNGLTMLQERYRILKEEAPVIKKEGMIFSVSLKILQHEHSNY
ncbi:MAG TPA: histidine kinase [Edaphocola sp.]|nr:histidine kinase [Edaphocola sp.]